MRIAQVTCVWPPYGAGVGVVARNQAQALVRLGHQVSVFTPAYHGELSRVIDEAGVRVEFLSPRVAYGNAAWLPQLSSKLIGFDVIHLHLYFIGATGQVLRAVRKQRVPLVCQYHNDLQGSGVWRWPFRPYTKAMLPRIVRQSAAILGLSTAHIQGSDLAWALPREARTADILPNAVTVERFSPGEPSAHLRTKLGITPNEQVLLFVGGLDRAHYFKGVPDLLQALALVAQSDAFVRLLIVGSGELQHKYQEQARSLGVEKHVVFVGAVQQQDLPEYYRLADVFVLPSVAVEAFPVVALEAMACELPVVVSALPGPAAVVGETGVVVAVHNPVALAQALIELLADEPRRKALGAAARQRVLIEFTWERIGKKLESVYQRVAAKSL